MSIKLTQVLPYAGALVVIVGLAFVGSLGKSNSTAGTINMSAVAESDYRVSTDQLSEFYAVASLSEAMRLASIDTVAGNYVTVSVMQETGQVSADKLEKPNIVDTSGLCQGICSHVVADGETMESIASRYGLTTDQIRWSNGLKTTDVSVGQRLTITGVPGITHVVGSGETAESIASKYGSSVADINAINNSLAVGATIVIPNGVPPATERPEYVAPTVVARTYTYTYTYAGAGAGRDNLHVIYPSTAGFANGNPMSRGNCTWFAWGWRNVHGNPLPGGPALGNARSWATVAARYGYTVNRSPSYGAVFQTTAGYYGHVGIVTGINADGSITIQEMNYAGYNVITEATIPASQVGNFYYIH